MGVYIIRRGRTRGMELPSLSLRLGMGEAISGGFAGEGSKQEEDMESWGYQVSRKRPSLFYMHQH